MLTRAITVWARMSLVCGSVHHRIVLVGSKQAADSDANRKRFCSASCHPQTATTDPSITRSHGTPGSAPLLCHAASRGPTPETETDFCVDALDAGQQRHLLAGRRSGASPTGDSFPTGCII